MKFKLILIILFTIISSILYSQEKPKHEKRIFTNEEGKIFIQKDLPIYVYISNSKDSSKKFLLTSTKTSEYVNPMYFDTEGYNTIRSPWAVDKKTKKTIVPKQDVIFDLYTDSKTPKTNIKFENNYINKSDTIIINKNTNIILISKDNLSGIQKIYYSINNEDYKEYKNKLNLIKEKNYNLKYYSVDNVGNEEKEKEINLKIDNSPPNSILKYEGDVHNKIISNTTSIIINSKDNINVKETFFSIDNSKFYKYGKILSSYFKEGEHVIKYYSIDDIGNKEKIKIDTFYIDKTPPIIIQDIIGNEYLTSTGEKYSSGKSKLKLTAFDNKAGVKEIYYSVNNKEFKKYKKPINLSIISGEINLKTYAIDNVNNKTNSQQKEEMIKNVPYIDLTPPKLNYSFIKPVFKTKKDIFISNKTKIILKGKDSESGINKIEYKIDENSYNLYKNPFSIKNEGIHTINYKGYDNVNNENNEKFNVIVDNTAPDFFVKFSIDPIDSVEIKNKMVKIYQPHLVIFFSSYDKYSGFEKIIYNINGGEKQIYKDMLSNFKINEYYEIEIEIFDKLGNSKIEKIHFYISE